VKSVNTGKRRCRWIWSLGLALCLAGCMPSLYGPSVPPPPPPAPPPPPPQVSRPIFYVTVNRLNLRACPGMDCPKISVLERNEEVEKVGDAEDWSQVRVKRDGRLGWVNSRYLSKEPVAAAPEVAPSPVPPPPAVVTPPPLPERPPAAEKPKPAPVPPVIKKKAEEAKPAKPAEAAEPTRRKPAPAEEKPAPKAEKPAPAKPAPPPAEKPAPPPEPAEPSGRIRIM
jgi:hypothetical protein